MPGMVVIVRAAGSPDSLPAATKSIAQSLDPKLFPEIRQLKLLYRENVLGIERIASIVSLIGIVAVLLAGVGLVGLVAFTISQRTREIAIRFALGAQRARVLVAFLRQFLWPVTLGLVAGTGVAAALSKLLRKALYGVSNLDPLGYAAAIIILIVIVVLAALLPMRRAMRLDIARALHHE